MRKALGGLGRIENERLEKSVLRKEIGEILWELCRQKDIEVPKGHARPDHVHMLLSVPPKYAIAFAIGYLKGKKAACSTNVHPTNDGPF